MSIHARFERLALEKEAEHKGYNCLAMPVCSATGAPSLRSATRWQCLNYPSPVSDRAGCRLSLLAGIPERLTGNDQLVCDFTGAEYDWGWRWLGWLVVCYRRWRAGVRRGGAGYADGGCGAFRPPSALLFDTPDFDLDYARAKPTPILFKFGLMHAIYGVMSKLVGCFNHFG